MTLAGKLLAIHVALASAGIPHAFGGAIALAYATRDPRGTNDIDVNIFLPVSQAEIVLDALPDEVAWDDASRVRLERDEQIRLWWEQTPVDLFFDYAPVHRAAARNHRTVPFAGAEIPILGAAELAIFKAIFDRSRDWVDIEEMLHAGAVEIAAVRRALVGMVGPDDPRIARLDELAGG